MDQFNLWLLAWLVSINVITAGFFWDDKKKAEHNANANQTQIYGALRRNSEKNLHRLEASGGVFSILALMYIIKHKNRKESYYIWTYIIASIWMPGLFSLLFNFEIPVGYPLLFLPIERPWFVLPAGGSLLMLPFIFLGLEVIGRKRKNVAQILCLLLGATGAHKFYLGQRVMGEIYLTNFLTIFLTITSFYNPLLSWLSATTLNDVIRIILLIAGAIILGDFCLISLTSIKEFDLKYNRQNHDLYPGLKAD